MKLTNFWKNINMLTMKLNKFGHVDISDDVLYNIEKFDGNIKTAPTKLFWKVLIDDILKAFMNDENVRNLFDYTPNEIEKIRKIYTKNYDSLEAKIFEENENTGFVFGGLKFGINRTDDIPMKKVESDAIKTFTFGELSEESQRNAISHFGTFTIDEQKILEDGNWGDYLEGKGFFDKGNYGITLYSNLEKDALRFEFKEFSKLYGMFQDEIYILEEVDELMPYVELYCKPIVADVDANEFDISLDFHISTPIEVAQQYAVTLERVEDKLRRLYIRECEYIKEDLNYSIEKLTEKNFKDNRKDAEKEFDLFGNLFDIYGELLK